MKRTGKSTEMGQGQGQGSGAGQSQGRNKGGSFGIGGFCICTKCGEKVIHKRGEKCTTLKCPKCGHTMIREEMVRNKKKTL